MRHTLSIGLCALMLAAPAALAQTGGTQQRNMPATPQAQTQQPQGPQGSNLATGQINTPVSTQTFVQRATASNMFEIESSELAQQMAQSDAVKGFAKEMIRDHTTAGQRMRQALGNTAKAETPSAEMTDPEMQQTLRNLRQAKGAEFDKLYIEAQVKAHEEAVQLFRTYATSGEDEKLRAFAKETLPTLERHRVNIREIEKKRGS